MITYRSADRGARRGFRCLSGAAVGASTLALALSGCGGSSKSNSTASPSTSSPPSASSTPAATNGQPLTKAQYEQKLSPLFNNQIDPALRSALSNGGAKNPKNLTQAIGLVQTARDAMASITPPAGVATIHHQAVSQFGVLIADMTKLRNAEQANNSSAEQSAATAVRNDALQIQNVGNKFVAKGY